MNKTTRWRTINKLAEYIKAQDPETALTESVIRRAVTSGEIPSVRAGKRYLVSIEAFEKFLSGAMWNPKKIEIKIETKKDTPAFPSEEKLLPLTMDAFRHLIGCSENGVDYTFELDDLYQIRGCVLNDQDDEIPYIEFSLRQKGDATPIDTVVCSNGESLALAAGLESILRVYRQFVPIDEGEVQKAFAYLADIDTNRPRQTYPQIKLDENYSIMSMPENRYTNSPNYNYGDMLRFALYFMVKDEDDDCQVITIGVAYSDRSASAESIQKAISFLYDLYLKSRKRRGPGKTEEPFSAALDSDREYQRFKLQWMLDHGYTLADIISELDKQIKFMAEEGESISLHRAFDTWEFDVGFSGEIWPCFDEWKDCEGKDI